MNRYLMPQIAEIISEFSKNPVVRTLFASLAEGVLMIGQSRTILFANPRAAEIFGYDAEELTGFDHIRLIPERYRSIHEIYERDYRANPHVRPMGQFLDLYGLHRDGRDVPLEISLSFLRADDGLLIIVFVSDITDRKAAEAEISRLNAELSARAEELVNVNREFESFNYSVAHDLRKPLTVASGYAQIVQELCSSNLSDECISYLQEIEAGTERMNRLIDALLNFSHAGNAPILFAPIDLSLLARQVVADLEMAEPERQVDITIEDNLRAYGDPGLIQDVLANLFGNAWKFTAGRGAEAKIDLRAGSEAGTFVVCDNGSGFSESEAATIFRPFHRLTGSAEVEGNGIGLATVERIIHRHGGSIRAEGWPGQGARFTFTLPVTNPAG